MPPIDEVAAVRVALENLRQAADVYFAKSFDVATRLAKPPWKAEMVDTNWPRFVPDDLVSEGDELGQTIPRLASRLVKLVQRSPLLSEPDVRDVKRLTKEMMAAL